MNENVIVLGATGGIAQALCRVLAGRGCRLLLAGRDAAALDTLAADLRVRYGGDHPVEVFDALDFDQHAAFWQRCVERLQGRIETVILCYGSLAAQQVTQTDLGELRRLIDVNFTSAASLLTLAAATLEQRRGGCLAAISSVAGDRGRQSNYSYGAAKAGLTAFLQGLRNRLHPAGVAVVTVKPGFVDTPMTAGLVDPRGPLVAAPERVARDIDRAIRRRRAVVYTPWFWRPIMLVIRALPEGIFKRLRL